MKALNDHAHDAVEILFKEWNAINTLNKKGNFSDNNNGLYILEICN